jgi:hypothetical protein
MPFFAASTRAGLGNRVPPRSLPSASRSLVTALALATSLMPAVSAWALDKQGSAHGGAVGAEEAGGLGVSGSLMLGMSLYNPSYAARPDNSGTTLMRYAGHADIDLLGRRLSLPLDVNMFSDREQTGAGKLRPSELDAIAGVTSTWTLGPGALELGARFEQDRALDRTSGVQSYVDARARYLTSLAALVPAVGPTLGGGDLRGYATLGVFAYNPTYFARPDNTGLALLRYGLHVELSLWDEHVALALDGTSFTDRHADVVVRPTELDFTPELVGRLGACELHLAYERDLPLDRGGLVQSFVYLLLARSFGG